MPRSSTRIPDNPTTIPYVMLFPHKTVSSKRPPTFASLLRFTIGAVLWISFQGHIVAAAPVLTPTPQGPTETLSPVRDRIVLNGVWKALPAVGPSETTPAGTWGVMWVPGSWFLGYAQKGTGPEWEVPNNTVRKFWYARQIDVPASWKGRKVILDFRQVSTDATVSVNGTDCGSVSWPYGRVDITKAVTPGTSAEVQVLVSATTDTGSHDLPMGPGQAQMLKAANKLSSAGLVGEVFLLSEPAGPTVSDVFVQPSVRKKQVSLEIEVTGITQDETAAFTATMMNAAGQAEQTFQGSLQLKAAPTQQQTVTFPWASPSLWSPEHPNLYTLQLKVDGTAIHDIYPQRFGFREFWIEGRDFFLNGQKIRLRPAVFSTESPWTLPGMDGYMKGLQAAGFNIVEQQPVNLFERGMSSQNREVWCQRADELGFLTIADGADFGSFLTQNNQVRWWDPGVREKYQARLEMDSRRYRNSPSVVMWSTTPNRYGGFQDQNPRALGVREVEFPLRPFQLQDIHNKAGLDGIAVFHTVDPTRPVFCHAGDMVGDVYTVNNYLDMIPLQEREEWLSSYAEKGDMPYMAVEFGLPLANPSVQRGRNGYGNASGSEPELTEYSAIYLGPDAYRLEPADYRNEVGSKFDGRFWTSFHNDIPMSQAATFQQVEALFIRNTWRSWRTAGVTGGMVPWSMLSQVFKQDKTTISNGKDVPFQPGLRGAYRGQERSIHYLDTTNGWAATPSSDALVEVNAPTVAWIAGAPENFYEKSHSFRTSQAIKKQVCLINDLATESDYHVDWKIVVGGKTLHEENSDGKIGVATNLFLPLNYSLPSTIDGEKAQGEIDLDATIGGRKSTDKFPFAIFNPGVTALPKMYLFDPQGKTADLLKSLGADVAPWTGEASSADRPLLVIGRQALSGVATADGKPPTGGKPLPADLEKFVSAGGHVLIMGQDPDWMRKAFGFRVNRQVSRRFFPVMADHPIVTGLDADDLRDWAGAGSLIEARPTYPLDGFAQYGWHWGNQGSVSCAAVETPHLTGWTPLLQGEFDLAYTPLMQLNYGSGLVMLCTLDLEDQAAPDPVAEILARRILQQTATMTPPPRRKTVYIGGDDGTKLLQSLGVTFDPATALPSPDELAIIGAGSTVTADQLTAFAKAGGNVLVLAAPVGQNVLGDPIESRTGYFGTLAFQSTFNSPLAGLGVSDLHFRTGTTWPVFSQGATVTADGLISTHPVGTGTIVATQLDPNLLNATKLTYFRFTRWRQTRALSQMLANLGASFAADGNIFHPGSKVALYYPDYNPHVWDGDDPGRYYRW
jgi:beta-galactosidase